MDDKEIFEDIAWKRCFKAPKSVPWLWWVMTRLLSSLLACVTWQFKIVINIENKATTNRLPRPLLSPFVQSRIYWPSPSLCSEAVSPWKPVSAAATAHNEKGDGPQRHPETDLSSLHTTAYCSQNQNRHHHLENKMDFCSLPTPFFIKLPYTTGKLKYLNC